MTFDEAREAIWKSLPPIRKRLAGRKAVDEIAMLAVENWQDEYVRACKDEDQRTVYAKALVLQIKRTHQPASGHNAKEYGFLWAVILQAVAVAVVQWLVQWWLERRANRVIMAGWKEQMR
jgi:hypothetical protein